MIGYDNFKFSYKVSDTQFKTEKVKILITDMVCGRKQFKFEMAVNQLGFFHSLITWNADNSSIL